MSKFTTIGLDLSINSTGVCINIEREEPKYYIIASDSSLTKKRKTEIASLESSNDKGSLEINSCLHYYIYDKDSARDDFQEKESAKSNNIYSVIHRITLIVNKYNPDIIYIEGVSYGTKNSRALADLAGLNFAVRQKLLELGKEFQIVAPTENKKAFTGKGNANKELILQQWLKNDDRLRNLIDRGFKLDDLADAYALSMAQTTKRIQ